MPQAQSVDERVMSLAAASCVELLEAYGVPLEASTQNFRSSEEHLFCGTVGFVGERFRGSCLVAGGEAVLSASCPSGDRLRDWVGELANQLAGRLKAKLIALSVDVALTTPIVISGVRLEPLPRSNARPVVYGSAFGDVVVWAEAEVTAGFAFGSEHPGASTEEGEVLLF